MGAEHLVAIARRLRELRTDAGLPTTTLEERMILGPGWIERIESGKTVPSLDMLLALLGEMGKSLADLAAGLPDNPEPAEVERFLYATPTDTGLDVHFRYSNFDAVYPLPGAHLHEFESVIKTLRDGLAGLEAAKNDAEAVKADAVANAFIKAVRLWPAVNPSDLWWFVVYRAYLDPLNHPARFARLSFEQSWKRTGGWALERVLVRHYGLFLERHGIRIVIGSDAEKARYLAQLKASERLEADKIDVLLLGERDGTLQCFGVVHVKASFAERRTDDVPMSAALVRAGYTSPLWTMDCKSRPGERPLNLGELGVTLDGGGADRRSAKRKDIEEDGYFSACFSYNRNTRPTPRGQAARARIVVCDFQNPDDSFSKYIRESWDRFISS